MGECTPQTVPELIGIGMDQPLSGRNDDVVIKASENLALNAKALSDLSLHLISLDGITACLERDPETVMTELVGNSKNSAFP